MLLEVLVKMESYNQIVMVLKVAERKIVLVILVPFYQMVLEFKVDQKHQVIKHTGIKTVQRM